MKAIRLTNGTVFVECEGVSIRILPDGRCGVSPILFFVLEWDLRTEPPSSWEYIGEEDVKALGDGVYQEIMDIVKRQKSI